MRRLLTRSGNITLTVIITLTLSLLCRLLSVRLSEFYSYRLIGKLTAFLQVQEFSQRNQTWEHSSTFTARFFLSCSNHASHRSLLKTEGLRINLNLDGTPITSKSHTHPSHSQTSRLLTSSLSLGVPVPPLSIYNKQHIRKNFWPPSTPSLWLPSTPKLKLPTIRPKL
jgi:hypothetical protein